MDSEGGPPIRHKSSSSEQPLYRSTDLLQKPSILFSQRLVQEAVPIPLSVLRISIGLILIIKFSSVVESIGGPLDQTHHMKTSQSP
jgi:hypothetical protein